ncbi:hypothetical protein, partial [Lapillicoccus sp.]|uniref:hypothetical protein n=1 Tax=Lapillicoccus sp. TaxID=1909287 RepID=UPI0025ECB5C2
MDESRARWAWVGLGAQVLITAYLLVAPFWQGAGYSVLAHSISDMYAVTAPAGAGMVVVLTLCGAATIAFVILALLPSLRPAGWPATLGCALLALSIFGLGDLLTPFERLACRLADPGCTSTSQLANAGGQLDSTLSTIGLVGGCFTAAAMLRLPGRKPLATTVFALCGVLVVVFVLLVVVPAAYGGAAERLLALAGAALLGV